MKELEIKGLNENLSTKSVKQLADRLNTIMIIRDKLALEHSKVVQELLERMPSLKDDPNLELIEEKEDEMSKGMRR